ncbi:MAG TPA: Gfo/Idh/MocA family oxidoreductase [Bryobacteraceae bacterium]|nr:Gfo/Idh/MocA family oxidoreductase [Bryobacteraceae bacterium]
MHDSSRRDFVFASFTSLLARGRAVAAEDAHGTAMIGTGNRGSYLLKTVLQEPRARVAAVCDIKPDRLDTAATTAARDKPATFTDYRKLLERKDVEAVFIAAPCDLHVEMAMAALRAGKHVYCEKPLGVTPESINDLLQVARSSTTVFMVGHQRRSDERLQKGVARIHEGILGRPVMMKAQRHSAGDFAHDGPSADWIFDAKRSGDVIVENAVHNLDVCNWAVNSRPERAAGFGGTLLWVNQPPGRTTTDGYTLSYEYANAVELSFTQVAFHPAGLPSGGQQTFVYGTEGAVDLEAATYYPRARGAKPQVLAEPFRGNREARHIGIFYDCIRTGRKPEVDIVVGATAALTAILGREAYRRKKVVTWKELGVEV